MFYVYALYNKLVKKLYIGQTNNLEVRLGEHNNKFGNHYTSRFEGRWDIVYSEDVVDRKSALVREKQLKSYKGREFLKQYISR